MALRPLDDERLAQRARPVHSAARRLDDLAGAQGRGPTCPASSSPWGFASLVPALALQVIDTGMHTELLSAIALVLALPGLSLLFLGVARAPG